ncbi:MAG: glycosyltransferase, partial [Sphingopyxis sp.]
TLLWARLHGAKIVLIDSFARFRGPSLFARLTGWLAHERIAQSAASAQKWAGSRFFDPFRMIDGPAPAKEPLLFATVGATLPFPRLVDYVDRAHRDGLLPATTIVQVGEGGRHPDGMDARDTIPFAQVQALLARAHIVVCHGGTGSLITALRAGCHVITIPREFALGEHYDDHQSEIAETFQHRGLLQMARDETAFRAALSAVARRDVVMATTDPAQLVAFLREWIAQQRGG